MVHLRAISKFRTEIKSYRYNVFSVGAVDSEATIVTWYVRVWIGCTLSYLPALSSDFEPYESIAHRFVG
jgi:hypothetical protein